MKFITITEHHLSPSLFIVWLCGGNVKEILKNSNPIMILEFEKRLKRWY
jgi:hypothetical protein